MSKEKMVLKGIKLISFEVKTYSKIRYAGCFIVKSIFILQIKNAGCKLYLKIIMEVIKINFEICKILLKH